MAKLSILILGLSVLSVGQCAHVSSSDSYLAALKKSQDEYNGEHSIFP